MEFRVGDFVEAVVDLLASRYMSGEEEQIAVHFADCCPAIENHRFLDRFGSTCDP